MNSIEKKIVEKIYKYYGDNSIAFDISDEFGKVLTNYFNSLSKRIRVCKRKVFLSSELKLKMKNEKIKKEHVENIERFIDDFEKGNDMNGHLSKQIYNSGFYDKLLICWGIHHLHLSSTKANCESEMTENRSDTLLFCIINGDSVYFIDAESHNREYVFSMFNLLNIISDNWLSLIDQFEVKDIIRGSLEPKVDNDETLYKLWKSNINIFYEIGGRVYSFIDRGLTGIGSNFGDALYITDIVYKIARITHRHPIMITDIKFELNKDKKPLGKLKWKEGNISKEEVI